MNLSVLLQTVERIGSPILGIIIPAVVLVTSFIITLKLYNHFAKKTEKN